MIRMSDAQVNTYANNGKNSYTKPVLTTYGPVKYLTTGGSVFKTENNGHPDGRF